MLEITQETLGKIDALLDVQDTEAVGELLLPLDRTSLRALLINVLRKRGAAAADAAAWSYLRATASGTGVLRAC